MDKIGVPPREFYGENKIVSVKFGSKCTYVGKDAFRDCKSLKTITFNDNNAIEEIYDGAFAGCDKISSIKLPSGLEKIGDLCLSTISKLYIPESLSEPPIFTKDGKESDDSYPFGYINSDDSDDSDYYDNSDDSDIDYIPQIKIFVPSDDLKNTYINNKYWKKYKDYIETYSLN